MKKNILVIFSDKFPNGGAGANRHLTIAKGLVKHGNKVTYHLIRPTESRYSRHKNALSGQLDGVDYLFTSGTNIWEPRSLISKFYFKWLGIIKSMGLLIRTHRKEKIHVVISGFSDFMPNFFYRLICKISDIRYVYNIDEYPWMIIHPKRFNKLYSYVFINYFYKLFDGIIVINKTLENYYTKLKRKKATILLIPMTVDPSRFDIPVINKTNTFNFVYAGSMSLYKDGVDMLIRAYSIFRKNTNSMDCRLILIGSNQDEVAFSKLKELVEENNLADEVVFTGEKHRDEIPELLHNADALVLARPNSIQAEGGFPTKLGEYLITKKPVIVTNVGEIPDFLSDNHSAFISEPDENCFASKMAEVYSDPDNAKRVGLNGYKLAMSCFDYNVQIIKLNSYLDNLIYNGRISNN